jgi:hypothetical protein
LHNDDKPAGSNLFASYCIRLQDLHQGTPTPFPTHPLTTKGYRHVPLVDLQGEKYIYSTLFVKLAWSLNQHILERPLAALGKLEKKAKAKARLAKLEEGSRSETSIESTGSSMSTSVDRMDREMEKIAEVNEAAEKLR